MNTSSTLAARFLRCLAVGSVSAAAVAQSPVDLEVVVDPNPTPLGASSNPSLFDEGASGRAFVAAGDYVYFNATDDHGRELWRCGAGAGTAELVADILPGPSGSEPRNHTVVGNRVFFTADDGVHGRELWVSDGTAAGTSLVADLLPGVREPVLGSFAAFGGELYFACDIGLGQELYATDGTVTGTRLIVDIVAGAGSGEVQSLQASPDGNYLLFTADDGVHGREVWSTAGSASSTWMLADLYVGSTGSQPRLWGALELGDYLYFGAVDANQQPLLCRSSGARLEVVRAFAPVPFPASPVLLFTFQGEVWFLAQEQATGTELYRTDGTLAGTTLWADLVPGPSGPGFRSYVAASDDSAFYLNVSGDLVTFDGSTMVRTPGLDVDYLSAAGNTVVGSLSVDPSIGEEPYALQPDGSYQLLTDLEPGAGSSDPSQFTSLGTSALFTAEVDSTGTELFVTDGSSSGTSLHTDIEPRATTSDFELRDLTQVGDRAYLSATGPGIGIELWTTDGTASGTRVVRDIRPGEEDSTPRNLTAFGQRALFTADDGVHGRELWITDGTAAGTRLVKDIHPGPESSFPFEFAVLDSVAYFAADDGSSGIELWRSDGTTAGTWLLADIQPGAGESRPAHLTASGRFVFFAANDGSRGDELWRTDGTASGTMLVAEINTDPSSNRGDSLIRDLTVRGDGVVFRAALGRETTVWSSDGHSVSQIASYADLGNRDADELATTPNGRVYVLTQSSAFRGRTGDLYLIEGSVTQLTTFPAPNDLRNLVTFGENAAFREGFDQLWGSNGQITGTSLLGTSRMNDSDAFAVGDVLYFSGSDAAEGSALWRTDATPAGTYRIEAFVPGTTGAEVEDLILVGGDLLFLADLPDARNVLHALRRPGASVQPFGFGCGAPHDALQATPPVLGQSMGVAVDGSPTSSSVIVNAEIFPGASFELLGCTFYFGQFAVPVLAAGSADATGSVPVPSTTALVGLDMVLQAVWLDGTGGIESSRPLWLSLDDK